MSKQPNKIEQRHKKKKKKMILLVQYVVKFVEICSQKWKNKEHLVKKKTTT